MGRKYRTGAPGLRGDCGAGGVGSSVGGRDDEVTTYFLLSLSLEMEMGMDGVRCGGGGELGMSK